MKNEQSNRTGPITIYIRQGAGELEEICTVDYITVSQTAVMEHLGPPWSRDIRHFVCGQRIVIEGENHGVRKP